MIFPINVAFIRYIPSNSVSMAVLPELHHRWKSFPSQPSGYLDFRRLVVPRFTTAKPPTAPARMMTAPAGSSPARSAAKPQTSTSKIAPKPSATKRWSGPLRPGAGRDPGTA